MNLATADNGWSAAFTVPYVTADEDAEFVLTVTPVSGLWSITILNNFWKEAKTQADLTFAPPLPSSDTSLTELEIYGVTPRYNSLTRIYELTVPNSVTTVEVRANPRERNAVVEIIPPDSQPATGHQVDLEPGANSISITVTATDEVTTQTYTVTVTRDESAGVCGRTQQVRDELVRLAGAGDCASVTADNLAAITNLDLENKDIASLQASDFAGLTSLVYLRLRNNQLSLDSFPGGLFSSLPLTIRSIEVSGNPGCPSHGNLCFPPTPIVDVLVGTDEREIAIVRTAETVRLRSGPGDYRDPLGRSLRTTWSQNTGTVVNLAAAYDGWSAAFTVPHVTADEDADFVLTVTPVSGLWSIMILNSFWKEANRQADLTFSPPDTAAPQVASIARQSPTSSPTRADSLTWRVTFSETVANVDEADFEVGVTTATLTVAAVLGSSVAHDVTVEGSNLAGLTGTVTLAFASDHDIADTAGNALTNTAPTGANDNTFELDNTAPTVTIGGVPETSTAPFTATITFTEPVTGFVLADIALANATAAAFTGADGDRAFTALITPTADGAVTVDVAADVARDAAGNGNAAAAQASFTYTAPSCAAPDLAGRERVWQGTLTVGRQAGGLLRELVGYGWTSRTGALSGRTAPIVLGANRYRIGDFVQLYAHTTNLDVVLGLPAAGTLVFHLVDATDPDAELTAAEKAALALHVCDARFDFSAATRRGEGGAAPPPGPGQDRHYLWENAGLTWSAGLVRTLTLSRPAVSGARAAAAVEGLPELTGPGEDGVYAARDRIEVRVRFDAPVTVDASGGAPTLGLALGGIRRETAYVPGQDGDAATELVFALAVSGEDAGAGAANAIANGIRLNGATIRDEVGADAVLDYGAAPGVVAVEVGAEPSGDGAWTAGEAVEVTLAFTEPVEVGTEGGTPSVGLTLPGAGARRAVYASGSGTDRLSFAYTLTGADGPVSAALVDPDGLAPGGGTIVSTGGLDAVLTHSGAGRTAGPRAPGPVLSVADAEAAEGGTLAFRVTLAPAASGPVTVAYATADGPSANGAVAGEDYTAASGTLAFKPGETEKTVAVAVAGDVPGEGAETLTLALSDATGASIGDGEATGTIGASAGPAALTASFLGVPPEHDGQAPFTVELRFSEEPQRLSYRTVRDSLFAVSGGALAKARRFEPPANLRYELTLAPSGDGAVTLARAALPACGAPGAVCAGDGRSLSGALALSVPGPAALSVADAQVKEGPDATLAFAVTLDRARHAAVTVDYATRDGTAVAGADYTNTSGTLTFVAGETRKTVDVQVLADGHDEGSETMTLALSNATGARIADGEATGTIDNSGSIPQAWIARFGRTVAEQVIEAVEGRMRAAPAPGAEVALAGERIGGQSPDRGPGQSEPGIGADWDASREEEARRDALRLADWPEGRDRSGGGRTPVAGGDAARPAYRLVLRADRGDGRQGPGLALGPGRGHALRRPRGRSHAGRRGRDRHARRRLDPGALDRRADRLPQRRRGRLQRQIGGRIGVRDGPRIGVWGKRQGRGDADRPVPLGAPCALGPAGGLGRGRLRRGRAHGDAEEAGDRRGRRRDPRRPRPPDGGGRAARRAARPRIGVRLPAHRQDRRDGGADLLGTGQGRRRRQHGAGPGDGDPAAPRPGGEPAVSARPRIGVRGRRRGGADAEPGGRGAPRRRRRRDRLRPRPGRRARAERPEARPPGRAARARAARPPVEGLPRPRLLGRARLGRQAGLGPGGEAEADPDARRVVLGRRRCAARARHAGRAGGERQRRGRQRRAEEPAAGAEVRLRPVGLRRPFHLDAGGRRRPVGHRARLQPRLAPGARRVRRRRRLVRTVLRGAPARERERRHAAGARGRPAALGSLVAESHPRVRRAGSGERDCGSIRSRGRSA